MKRFACLAATAMALLLGGCATTIRSDVTTFQQWPATLADKSFAFEAPTAQEDTLEYRSYQNLVRAELGKLGFTEATGKPALLVSMRFATIEQPIRVVEVRDPFYMSPSQQLYLRPGPFSRFHRGYYPFYDPFWPRPVVVGEDIENAYQRQLQVAIKSAADGKRLFDVTVQNVSKEASTPIMMPALVHSAFVGFPGPNGVARKVELKQEG
jgi:hypothetical protein